MNITISKRFLYFLLCKCKTGDTNQNFRGQEWARIAYNAVLISNGMATYRRF